MSGTSVKGGDGDRVPASEGSRHGRRRQRTRGRLVEAARRVIGRRGVGGRKNPETPRQAHPGVGTFYNYFDSKEAILAAATAEATEELGHALDRLNARLDDPAGILSVAVPDCRRVVRPPPVGACGGGPFWGWFVVRPSLYQEQMAAVHGHRLAADLRRGVEARCFPETD